ncbi:MAG TPA: hypothetical protein VFK14_11695 [Solirubrobacterales bacterium]|nr:hypothetical protein [Solirubrobacterales bacterium]
MKASNARVAPVGGNVLIRGVVFLVALATLTVFTFLIRSVPAAQAQTGVAAFFGGQGVLGGQFGSSSRNGLAVNQTGNGAAAVGDLYVIDSANRRVQQFSADGQFIRAFGLDVGGDGNDVCATESLCQAGTESASAGGLSNNLGGIAVDSATGNVFVTDELFGRVDVFSATGSFEGAFGWEVDAADPEPKLQFCTIVTGCEAAAAGSGPGQFEAVGSPSIGGSSSLESSLGQIAINPLNGDALVADVGNRRVDEFSLTTVGGIATGAGFVRGYGWGAVDGAAAFQICTTTCHTPGPTGSALGQFTLEGPEGLVVDGTGRAVVASRPYLAENPEGEANLQAFDPSGSPLGRFGPSLDFGRSVGATEPWNLAVDRAACHVWLLASELKAKGTAPIRELSCTGEELAGYLAESGYVPIQNAIAVAESSKMIYVTDRNLRGVLILGEVVNPSATLESPPEFMPTPSGGLTVTAEGQVNSNSLQAEAVLEVSRDGVKWTKATEYAVDGASFAPVSSASIPSDSNDHTVKARVPGLLGNTEYRARLVVNRLYRSGTAEVGRQFTTPSARPIVSGSRTSAISDVAATLNGEINPENEDTQYRFEYVTASDFAESGFASAVEAPVGSATVGAATGAVVVSQPVTGLQPFTTYRYRLVAENGGGQTVGEEQSGTEVARIFTTFPANPNPQTCPNEVLRPGPAVALPDCRAYEQVSPTQKNGNSIQAEVNAVEASSDGNRVIFYANGGLPGGEGASEFPSYLAARTVAGGEWSTQGLLPSAVTGSNGKVLGWNEALSAIYDENRRIPGLATLYQRSSENGDLTAVAANGEAREEYKLAGDSENGEMVVFEYGAGQLLPNAAAGERNVYLWDRATGELHLASALNNGRAPTKGAIAGPYKWYSSPISTNDGGAAALYYTQPEHVISADGARVFFTAAESAQLYMRVNPIAAQSLEGPGGHCTEPEAACTIQISSSKKTNGSGPGGTDPNGPKPAAFVGATANGSRALFMSASELTNDANTGPSDSGNDLYRYEAGSEQLEDISVDGADPAGAEVKGVLGMNQDASYVYFLAAGHLTADAPATTCNGSGSQVTGTCNVYLWHESGGGGATTTFVTQLSGAADFLDWVPTSAPVAKRRENTARVSLDGKTLLFASKLKLSSYESEGISELYRYSVGGGRVACVSCAPTGARPIGPASLQSLPEPVTGPHMGSAVLTRNLSEDGARVFFNTPDKLVSSDVNGEGGCPFIQSGGGGAFRCEDVYEWEANGSGSCHESIQGGGCLYLISTGTSREPSLFLDTDTSGNNVFFLTGESLVRQDKDELVDAYDASVNGGLASQNQAPPPICEGEAGCLGTAPTAGAAVTAGSATFVGPGNPQPKHCKKPKKCRKHHHRKHHQRKHHHRKHHPKSHKQDGNGRKGGVR